MKENIFVEKLFESSIVYAICGTIFSNSKVMNTSVDIEGKPCKNLTALKIYTVMRPILDRIELNVDC
jgi:hypothetical protein